MKAAVVITYLVFLMMTFGWICWMYNREDKR